MSRHTGVANWARPAASERADHHGHRCARARPARDRTPSLACLLKVERRDPTKDANRNFGSLPTTRRRSLALYSTPVVYRKGLQRCCAEWVPAWAPRLSCFTRDLHARMARRDHRGTVSMAVHGVDKFRQPTPRTETRRAGGSSPPALCIPPPQRWRL